jgi:hypothetical protein
VRCSEDRNIYEADELTLRSMYWKFRDELNRDWQFSAKPPHRRFFPFPWDGIGGAPQ